MSDRGHHCPFLNRADSRCSEHFNLDHLGHAFDYCFGYYDACAVYARLLAERQMRRATGPGRFAGSRLAEFDLLDDEMDGVHGDEGHHAHENHGGGLIQVTVGRRTIDPRHAFDHSYAEASHPIAG